MIKKVFILAIILLIGKNIFAQQYFKIEGTKRIFTFYGKKSSDQINDSITMFYYVKNKNFYLAVKSLNTSLSPYVKYCILNKKEKSKVKSIGKGSNEVTRVRFIEVNLIRAEKISVNSQFIEEIIKR